MSDQYFLTGKTNKTLHIRIAFVNLRSSKHRPGGSRDLQVMSVNFAKEPGEKGFRSAKDLAELIEALGLSDVQISDIGDFEWGSLSDISLSEDNEDVSE